MESAIERFITEYSDKDEDLVDALLAENLFWQSKEVQQALITLIRRPGAWQRDQQEIVRQHFTDLLPKRRNRERVDTAVAFFLTCIVEELWTLPGAQEIRTIYGLQFQKMASEAAKQQVLLLEAQLHAMIQLDSTIRQALLELAATLEQRLLTPSAPHPILPSPHPYQNVPYPDYVHFVGRLQALEWVHQRLSPHERAWQIVITGIGGVGKSTLALVIAHWYRQHYEALPPDERFDAMIWISAKEEILTIQGREQSALPGQIFRTLEDIYTTIAQTLEREDITRAIPEERDYLVHKALSTLRALLIVDNLESVIDERVKVFLRTLPPPTKCLITSREWVDVAAIWKLTGLSHEEAHTMITAETAIRMVTLNEEQQERLVERTVGLPLPIKLSVARLASGETMDQIMRWLGDATGDLPEYCVKGQFEIIAQRSPTAWRLLLACSLFDKNVSIAREALGAIADVSLADRDEGIAMLQRFSLLNCTEFDRLWILPMVQVHAAAMLAQSDLQPTLIERWLAWWLNFTDRSLRNLGYNAEPIQQVSGEYPHIISTIRWCRQHQYWHMVIQLVEGAWCYPHILGLFTELAEMLEAAIDASHQLHDERLQGKCLRRQGLLLWAQGRYTETLIGYLDQAAEIARRYHDEVELGFVLNLRWDTLFSQGQLQEAEELSKHVLEIGTRHNEVELQILSTGQLATLEAMQQHYNNALVWLDISDRWCQEQNWPRKSAWNSYFRGSILAQQGAVVDAEPYLVRSLEMALSWGERRLIARAKERLIQVYAGTERLHRAIEIAHEASDLYERLGMLNDADLVKEVMRTLQGKKTLPVNSTTIVTLPPSTL